MTERKTEISEEDYHALRDEYPMLDKFAPYGFPITRDQVVGYNYIISHDGEIPEKLGAEEELDLPPPLRHPDYQDPEG